MKDNLGRAGKIILILAVVVLLITYVHGLNKDAHSPPTGQASTAQAELPQSPVRSELWRISAYCICSRCCGKWSDGITASGKPAVGKLIAAPPEIPFGTWIDIPGYGIAEVLDRGGVIKGRRLDLLFSNHQAALNWGVQYLEIRL